MSKLFFLFFFWSKVFPRFFTLNVNNPYTISMSLPVVRFTIFTLKSPKIIIFSPSKFCIALYLSYCRHCCFLRWNVCLCVCVSAYIYTYVYVCVIVVVCVFMCVFYGCVCLCVYVCVYLLFCPFVCICVCVCVYISIFSSL